ncbi:DeoR/GlpR family DNA-binding transcription regulator [Thalassolituus sp. LLYu03]|uniref:DeoR/GlpR family DNA-binding transcription regulator n=1 Tax=Thalassolituus sp. LLYu03 TaxID=3421656 RepID=UPI003D2B3F3E
MPKRNTVQRRHGILERLSLHGQVQVDELAKAFETSEVTIRKDLAELEKSGVLLRRYGGAVPLPAELIQTSSDTSDSKEKVSERKKAIARAAADCIRDHNRIIIDFGTTTAALIPRLQSKRGLVVMTNSLTVANAIRELENEPTLLLSGGTWDTHSESFQGQIAEQVIRSYDFDQLFIGCDGIDLERGTTTFNELLSLSRVMADSAREVVVMAEADKIGRRIPNLELPWSAISVLITDDRMTAEQQQHIEQQGVRVVIAPSGNGE